MPIFKLDLGTLTPEPLNRAAETLRSGGLVALPTETVYGLAANALDATAVQKIYAAKGRPSFNPLIVHVENAEAAQQLVSDWPELAQRLSDVFWPGPLTLVLPKRKIVPDEVTAGLDSVAVRAPAHPVAQALLRASGLPLAAPSANRFTELSPTTAAHVAKAFGDELLILDGGECRVGIESTVLDLSGDVPTLLRHGGISRREIEAVIGPIALNEKASEGEAARPSPGMVERHYSPRAELQLVPSDELTACLRTAMARGRKTALLQHTAEPLLTREATLMPAEPAEYARKLYALLHALDDRFFELIIVESPPQTPEWAGVLDRLTRATK